MIQKILRALQETLSFILQRAATEAERTRNRFLIQLEIQREIDQKLNTSEYESDHNISNDFGV